MLLPEFFERTRTRLDVQPPGPTLEAAPGVGSTLPFVMQSQQREKWCWAAVSVSVAKFYDSASPWRQCQLVNDQFGLADCCSNGGGGECDQLWFLELGLDRVGHFLLKEQTSVPFQTVADEIEAGRPLGCSVRWPDATEHFVILNGYSTDFGADPPREWVSIEDPKYGHSDYIYLKFLVSYRRDGVWELSYFTRP